MMDWTDRHCRYFHRLLTRRARLYTEMVATGAVLHGDAARHLDFDSIEQPVALQLGGSEPAELAAAARLGARWGYAEINLNCGCPSERVQRGAFGACLMKEPGLVAEAVAAMRDAVTIPVTVKHRIGVDRNESYAFVRDFVGTVAEKGGCAVFIVHARSAWLHGVSPKENRTLPPLRHEVVARLQADFPALVFVLNGGVTSNDAIAAHLATSAGVMVGRMAYHDPRQLTAWDGRFFGDAASTRYSSSDAIDMAAAINATGARGATGTRDAVDAIESAMVDYMTRCHARDGTPWPRIARHMLGLRHGEPGARRWRQVWSDHRQHDWPAGAVAERARREQNRAAAAPVEATA